MQPAVNDERFESQTWYMCNNRNDKARGKVRLCCHDSIHRLEEQLEFECLRVP